MFNSVVEEKFHDLQNPILRWERETEESRAALMRQNSEPAGCSGVIELMMGSIQSSRRDPIIINAGTC